MIYKVNRFKIECFLLSEIAEFQHCKNKALNPRIVVYSYPNNILFHQS